MPSRRTAAAALLLTAGGACSGPIVVDGPVTEIGGGRICVRSQEAVPGRGCATYPSEDAVAGIGVGDCVRMRLYAESGSWMDIRKRECPG
jgi:hypothetical protein